MNEELAEIMDEFDAENAPADDYVPATEEEFEYRLRALKSAEDRIAHLKAWRDGEVTRLVSLFERRISDAEGDAEHQRGMIEVGIGRLPEGERKVKAPTATVYEATTERVEWDEPTAFEWAIDNDCLRQTLDKSAVKAHVKETGEDVPGLTITNAPIVKVRWS